MTDKEVKAVYRKAFSDSLDGNEDEAWWKECIPVTRAIIEAPSDDEATKIADQYGWARPEQDAKEIRKAAGKGPFNCKHPAPKKGDEACPWCLGKTQDLLEDAARLLLKDKETDSRVRRWFKDVEEALGKNF